MNTIDFIALIYPYAVSDQLRSGVLASITISQGILESASGNSAPGNNLFGIKGQGQVQETKEFVNGEWITIHDGFRRVYNSWADSVRDHSDFLRVNQRYKHAGFFDCCEALDYRGAAIALRQAGYATDPNYAQQLIELIDSYALWKYDAEAKKKMDEWEKRISELEVRLAALQQLTAVLEKTPPPDWFITEFGQDALHGIVNDPNGDLDFWRNLAIVLRLNKKA